MVSEIIAAVVGVAALVLGVAVGFVGHRQFVADDSDPETVLSRPARELDTRREPDAVTTAVETLVDTVETIERAGDLPASVDVSRSDPPAVRAAAIEQAVSDRDLVVTASDDRDRSTDGVTTAGREEGVSAGSDAGEANPAEHVVEAAQAVRTEHPPRSRPAERLLNYLSDPETVQRRQVQDTLRTVVAAVEEQHQLTDVLGRVDRGAFDSPRGARAVSEDLREVDGDVAGAVVELCESHAAALADLEDCQSDREAHRRAAETVCSAAVEQAAFEPSVDSASDRLSALAESLDRGVVAFREESGSVESIATEVERSVDPRSALGREFVGQLADRGKTSDRELETTLQRVLETLDEAEVVRHRLDDIDRAEVERLADRLADDLDASSPVEDLLRERVIELAETVQHANDADTVVVYAARQELRYYDRTFLPTFREADAASQEAAVVRQRLSEVEQRRSDIRTNYPSRYPEHNHTIPIHFLDLVEAIHGEASEATETGDLQRAKGLLTAADRTLDWVEKLYERHAYSALLQQLRG